MSKPDSSTLLQKITRCQSHVCVSRHTLCDDRRVLSRGSFFERLHHSQHARKVSGQAAACSPHRSVFTCEITRNSGQSVRNVMVCICMSPPPSACLLGPFGGSGVAMIAARCPEQRRPQSWFLRQRRAALLSERRKVSRCERWTGLLPSLVRKVYKNAQSQFSIL